MTAGDHMLSITTSPLTIRFTDCPKVSQNARKWPSSFLAMRKSMRKSISSRVMLPLSLNLNSPSPSMPSAASMTPIWGTLSSATAPLKSSLNSSAQLSIFRPVSSGLYPIESALCQPGTIVT